MNTETTNTQRFNLNESQSPPGYSIFDSSDNERQRILFDDNNDKMTGFLKLPGPGPRYIKKKSIFVTVKEENYLYSNKDNDNLQENRTRTSSMSFSEEQCIGSVLVNRDGDDTPDDGGREDNLSRDVTEDIHKRLQDQLVVKQREVQEIQQKIVKSKKWASDSRRGPQDRNIKYAPKPRTGPESTNQLPVFDINPKRMKNERFGESGSTLDPNSPCFYPSQFTFNNPVLQPEGTGQNNDEQSELPHGDIFNPLYPPPPLPTGCPNMSSSYNPLNTDIANSTFKNNANLGNGLMSNPFGVVARPVLNFEYPDWKTGKTYVGQNNNYNKVFWPKPSNFDFGNKCRKPFYPGSYVIGMSEEDRMARQRSNNFLINDNPRNSYQNSTNQNFNSSWQNSSKWIGSNLPPDLNIETQKDIPTTNTFNPGRLRMVRKRQETVKSHDSQMKPSTTLCPSCKHNFQWPHIISCLHSFCFSCIVKHFDKEQNQIKCPTCSTVTELNDTSLKDLHIDSTTCNSLLQANVANPFSCMACSLDKQASTFCEECMQFICCECRSMHKVNTVTASHQLHGVKKVQNDQGRFGEMCQNHPDKQLEQYCDDCKQLVCTKCISFGERHSAHNLGDINELYPMAVNKIRLMCTHLDQIRSEVQKKIQPLTILKQHIENSVRVCKQDIHKYSNFLLSETEKCRTNARLVIDKAHEDFTKDIEVGSNLMAQYLSEHSPLIDFFRRYFLLSSPQDFMSMAPMIQQKIKDMNEKHEEIKKHGDLLDASVSFKADYAGVNDYLQNQYNRILITENLSDALPSDSSEMGRLIEKDILAELERSSRHPSPRTSDVDVDLKTSSGSSGDEADPQSEMFDYKRTAISYIHQFGKRGRGEYEFVEPSGVLYLLDGSLAVCDTANHRIMVYDDQLNYVRTIGQPPNLPPLRDRKEMESRNDKHLSRTPSCLYFPYRIAQCPQTENIVVVERPPSRDIQIFTVFGQFLTCFGSDILQHPRGVAVDEHGVIVTVEGRTMKLMLFSQEGQLLHRFFLSVHLEFPNDVAARDGLIYISDNRGHCVHVFDYNAEPRRTIGNESVTYYPIGVSLTHLNQVVVTDNHNTFNISVFDASNGRYVFGFKSKVRHANCYNVAVHPHRLELAVTSRENQVVIFNFDPLREVDEKDNVNETEILFHKEIY